MFIRAIVSQLRYLAAFEDEEKKNVRRAKDRRFILALLCFLSRPPEVFSVLPEDFRD